MDGTDQLRITLDRETVLEFRDALRARADAWHKTAEFIESGYISDDSAECENCDDADEALRIAERYDRIVTKLESQMVHQ